MRRETGRGSGNEEGKMGKGAGSKGGKGRGKGAKEKEVMVKRTALQLHMGDRPHTEVAKGLGMSKSLVSRVLSGQRSPSLDTAEKMARVLGLTLDEFVEMRRRVVMVPAGGGNGSAGTVKPMGRV
jgi:plasmid maintenance system antidote protein VapI